MTCSWTIDANALFYRIGYAINHPDIFFSSTKTHSKTRRKRKRRRRKKRKRRSRRR